MLAIFAGAWTENCHILSGSTREPIWCYFFAPRTKKEFQKSITHRRRLRCPVSPSTTSTGQQHESYLPSAHGPTRTYITEQQKQRNRRWGVRKKQKLTPIERQFSSGPVGNFTINLDPARSSLSFSGRKRHTTLMLSSAGISRSPDILLPLRIAALLRVSCMRVDDGGDNDDSSKLLPCLVFLLFLLRLQRKTFFRNVAKVPFATVQSLPRKIPPISPPPGGKFPNFQTKIYSKYTQSTNDGIDHNLFTHMSTNFSSN